MTHTVASYVSEYHKRYFTEYPLQEIRQIDGGRVAGRFFNSSLYSVFQPVLDAGTGETVGHEAFVRTGAAPDSAISPWGVFSLAASAQALVQLDRLCRTVHMLNYFSAPRSGLLFANVHPGLLASVKQDYGKVFEEIIGLFDVKPRRIVIELPGEVIHDHALLDRVIRSYRARGYKVALNHVGGADAWIGALRGAMPDIVKVEAGGLAYGQRLCDVVERLHSEGACVLVKKIQRADQAEAARDSGADLLQGFHLASPTAQVVAARGLGFAAAA